MKILIITSKELTGLNYHRQIVPHKQLVENHEGYRVSYAEHLDLVTDEELKDFQIVSFLRIIDVAGNTNKIVKRAKDAGCKTILDIDDYWHLPATHQLNQSYLEHKIAEQTVESIKAVDYITTTTEFFADKIKELNDNVIVFPNSIYDKEEQFNLEPVESDRIRLGWIGGVFHFWDLALMRWGIQDVYKTVNKDKYQFCLGGYNKQYDSYERLFTVNGKYTSTDRYKRLHGLAANKYATMYNDIDVALVPLNTDPFSGYKSQIKIIEAGWFKKPVIVSSVMPYLIDCNKSNSIPVLPSKSNDGWGIAMKSMIHNKNRREDLAEQLHEDVKAKYDMNIVNISRNQFYQNLTK